MTKILQFYHSNVSRRCILEYNIKRIWNYILRILLSKKYFQNVLCFSIKVNCHYHTVNVILKIILYVIFILMRNHVCNCGLMKLLILKKIVCRWHRKSHFRSHKDESICKVNIWHLNLRALLSLLYQGDNKLYSFFR